MFKLLCTALTATAAGLFTAGDVNVWAGDADVARTVTRTAPAGATQAALVSLETSAYQAWKSRDTKFWKTFLSDQFVGWGSTGRLDKASATREFSGTDCTIRSFAISDVQLSRFAPGAALITHKTTVDGTCNGQKSSPASWVATAYRREAGQWKAVFHAEAVIVDPAAPPAQAAASTAGDQQKPARPARPAHPDAGTNALLPLEKAVWDAWKDHDTRRMDDLTAKDFQFINIFGIHLPTKADALKDWSGKGCDVKAISLTDAQATLLSPTVAILTFHASADGACFGQKIGPVWGSSVYVKHGATWRWNFGINVPAR
ncbi:MAG: nuclear transport factor 2 family protein [Proteobacteria bacterium]|nr:nuclear transport factor 2 family protein [Pseudomonadota bacterium]